MFKRRQVTFLQISLACVAALFCLFTSDIEALAWFLVFLLGSLLVYQIFFLKRYKSIFEKRTSSLIASNKFLQAQHQALLALTKSKLVFSADLNSALQEICQTSAKTLKLERVGVWLFEEEAQSIRCTMLYDRGKFSSGQVLLAKDYPAYFQAITNNRVIAANQALSDIRTNEFAEVYLKPNNIGAMLDAPVRLDTKVIGIVCHEHVGQERIWSSDEQSFAASIADMVALAYEINKRRKVEQKLNDAKEFLRNVIDTNPSLIFVRDTKGRFTLVNKAMADFYGRKPEEMLWKTLADVNGYPDLVEKYMQEDRFVLDQGKEIQISEEKNIDSKGVPRYLTMYKKPLVSQNGEVEQVLGVGVDVSETINLRQQLLQSQKMEAIGQLAGGIAHDFNNLITAILGYTGLLKLQSGQIPNVLSTAEMIEKAGLRAEQLTTQLLGFARKGKNQDVVLDLQQVIKDSISLLERTIEKNITIISNLKVETPFIKGDPVQMEQVMINLAINARDAMSAGKGGSNGGTLEIFTNLVEKDSLPRKLQQELKASRYLEVCFRDSGCGMKDEVREKIFEPFFTTKAKGTGMGLAMVYGIIKNHQGGIDVSSKLGQGTSIRIFLPLNETKPQLNLVHTENKNHFGNGQILFVDDHEYVRGAAQGMLEYLGYKVIVAKDAIEALAYYRENFNKVDLVILDLIMPNMDGAEALKIFKKLNPNVKIILSTGYGNNNQVQELLDQGLVGFIQKPYQISKLSEVVLAAMKSDLQLVINQ